MKSSGKESTARNNPSTDFHPLKSKTIDTKNPTLSKEFIESFTEIIF
jgi:hypothetical protein